MAIAFSKLHGCGNDYVYLDGFAGPLPAEAAWPKLARAMSDRHRGIGSDGLIIIRPSPQADAEMVMLNADGSRSEMCGNGIRCAAKLAFDRNHVATTAPRWLTGAGILTIAVHHSHGRCTAATVNMGRPRLTPAAVPVDIASRGPILALTVEAAGHHLELIAVGMGNPHAVCFVADVATAPVLTAGPIIERHPLFPCRTNVEFVHVDVATQTLHQRTWERGAGETQACGTGACAATVAAILTHRLSGRSTTVRLLGGALDIAWPDDLAEVTMTGEAIGVFDGVWPE